MRIEFNVFWRIVNACWSPFAATADWRFILFGWKNSFRKCFRGKWNLNFNFFSHLSSYADYADPVSCFNSRAALCVFYGNPTRRRSLRWQTAHFYYFSLWNSPAIHIHIYSKIHRNGNSSGVRQIYFNGTNCHMRRLSFRFWFNYLAFQKGLKAEK